MSVLAASTRLLGWLAIQALVPTLILAFASCSGSGSSDNSGTSNPCPVASGSPGALDTSFGTGGYVVATNPGGHTGAVAGDQIVATAVDSQCRIIAVGSSVNLSGNVVLAVWRFTTGGSLDSGFANGGLFTKGLTGGGPYSLGDHGNAVAVDSQDRIVVAGYTDNPSSVGGGVVWRLTSSGALDGSFGTGGFTLLPALSTPGGLSDSLWAVALDSAGRIYTAGVTFDNTNKWRTVTRLSSAGVFDSSFGNAATGITGVFGVTPPNNLLNPGNSALLLDGANPPNMWLGANWPSTMDVYKILPNGTGPDSSFAASGVFNHQNTAGGSADAAVAIAREPGTGRIFAAGWYVTGAGGNAMAIWTLNSGGALDTTGFTSNGYVTASGAGSLSGVSPVKAYAIARDSGGRLVAAGLAGSAPPNMAVWRFKSDGTADSAFGTSGSSAFADPFSPASPSALGQSLTIDSAGNLIVGGYLTNAAAGTNGAVWRVVP